MPCRNTSRSTVPGCAPNHHGKFKHIKEVGADGLAPHPLRLAAAANRSGKKLIVSSDTGEGLRPVAHIVENGERKIIAALIAIVHGLQREQRRWIAHRRGPQHKAADHGEDGGVRADPEADGENGNRRDHAMLAQRAQAVGEVAHERLEPGQRSPLAMRLPRLLCTAEANKRLTACFLRAQACTDAIVCM
jgi:hypothetical protein